MKSIYIYINIFKNMALSSGKANDMVQSKKRTWGDLNCLKIGRDSLDSFSTIMNEEDEGIMGNSEELIMFISRIIRRWREEWVEVSKERIKDIVRREDGSSDEEKNEPSGEELGRIGPTIGELLVGWGNVWCIDTQRDIYNRYHMLLEDRTRPDVNMVLCNDNDLVEE